MTFLKFLSETIGILPEQLFTIHFAFIYAIPFAVLASERKVWRTSAQVVPLSARFVRQQLHHIAVFHLLL